MQEAKNLLPVAVFHQDPDLCYTWAHGRLAGWDPNGIIGKTDAELWPEREAAQITRIKRQVLETGEAAEMRLAAPFDGEPFVWQLSIAPFRNSRGEVLGLVTAACLVSEPSEIEQALRESETRFRSTFENVAVGMSHVGLDGSWLRVNQRLCDIVGYDKRELLQKTFQDITYPDDLAADLAQFEMLKRGELSGYQMEKRYLHKQGHIVWIHLTVTLERDAAGQPLYCICVIQDITAHKRFELALQDAQTRPKATLAAAEVGTWIYEATTDRVAIDENLARIYGISFEKAMPGPLHAYIRVVHPEDRLRVLQEMRHAIEQGSPYEVDYRIVRPDGSEGWVVMRGRPELDEQGAIIRFPGVVLDITERKQAEEALREAHAALAAQHRTFDVLMSATDDHLYLFDRDKRYVYANQAALRALGLTSEQLIGKSWRELRMQTQTMGLFEGELDRVFLTGQVAKGEVAYLAEYGARHYEYLINPVFDDECAVMGAAISVRDITERKAAEEALRESEERFRQLADSMPQLVWTARPDGVVDYCNQRRQEFEGITPGPGETWEWALALHPDDRQRTLRAWDRTVQTGEAYEVEHRVYRADGDLRWYLSRGVPVRDDEGNIVKWYGTATDIHEWKQAERALWELNRNLEERVATRTGQVHALASALNLAEQRERQRISQVLHDDLQQLLYSQLMRLEMLRQLPAADPPAVVPHVDGMAQLMGRAIQVTRALVSELKPPRFETGELEEALQWLARQMEESHGLTVHFVSLEPSNLSNPDLQALLLQMVREILFNVVKHAETHEACLTVTAKNGYILLRIEDKGKGFDVQALGAGQPKQSGTGLVSVAERLELIDGWLEVDSSEGHGTCVTLVLPATTRDEW